MISMSMFLSIKALAEEGLAKKAIARRLGLNVRTVRRQPCATGGATSLALPHSSPALPYQ